MRTSKLRQQLPGELPKACLCVLCKLAGVAVVGAAVDLAAAGRAAWCRLHRGRW
jgi:hypothetical protein